MKKIIALSVVALVALAGCASANKNKTAHDMGAVNTLCPMQPDCALPADSPTTTWNGKKVAFCCQGCVGEWGRIDDKERAERLAKAQ
ncbi:MAG TPA: hypothetical protein VK157_16785 [Phycisphaerales bacterium]|nr:hypothetical protein [Phycisphaerales bacterium]